MTNALNQIIQHNTSAFYTFDISLLKKRIAYLKSHLPKEVSLCYAVKANTFVSKEIQKDVDKFEICSPGEAYICKAMGIPSEQMVISGVYKTPSFIEELVADSSFDGVFTIESLVQHDLLCALSKKYQRTLPVLIRLTNDSQFGVNDFDIEQILSQREQHPTMHYCGIQFFSGTQKTSIKKMKREIEALDTFLLHLQNDLHYTAEQLEYGTGFPVSYFEGETFDEETYLSEFSALLENMTFKAKITLEVGRSIVASCGKYYTHIVDIKENKGMHYAIVDGGMHHIVYFGQAMAMKHPFLSVLGKERREDDTLWAICGSLCSMNDIIAKQIPLPQIEVGDIICFENTGAYCMDEGISLFLSRDIPAIYLLQEDGSVTRARSTFETAPLNTPKYERI